MSYDPSQLSKAQKELVEAFRRRRNPEDVKDFGKVFREHENARAVKRILLSTYYCDGISNHIDTGYEPKDHFNPERFK